MQDVTLEDSLTLRYRGLANAALSTSRTEYPTEFWLLTPEFCFDQINIPLPVFGVVPDPYNGNLL
ncbi:hypothetical protein [Nostoc sp. C110]|uniref:hypothetical protein n=1 Tax=Nostoc sp. C110 TaxID=3349876 RepID=UPI00370D2363